MAAQRVAGTGVVESGPSNHHFPHAAFYEVDNTCTSFINQGPNFNFGELEEAIVLQGVRLRNDEARASFFAGKPATLEIFPSWPMRFQPSHIAGSSKSRGESSDLGSAMNKLTASKAEGYSEQESPTSKKSSSSSDNQGFDQNVDLRFQRPEKMKGTGSESEKLPDAKKSRRLAQNRAAAKKSRLRRKAYIQQLEASRMKLSQIEQDLRRSHSQGLFSASSDAHISSGGVVFDMEYTRWLEEDRRQMTELRSGLEAHLSNDDLQSSVDEYISHYDEIFRLKGAVVKSDVFHLITGKWITPVERYFLWMGGFRPSELIKMLISQLDPLSEQQAMGIYRLQNSTQQAEEALSQGQEQLQQSLLDTIAGGPIINGMNQMLMAVGKLSNLEGLVRQADILRQQTLHQLCRLLTTRQAAQCFVVIGEYYSRLRALGSIWATRPQEPLMNDGIWSQTIMEMQTIIEPSHNQFPVFRSSSSDHS